MTRIKKILLAVMVLVVFIVIKMNVPENKNEIRTDHFTFVFSRSIDTSNIIVLSKALENNYYRISNDLKTVPAQFIETNIYAQRWRYIKATGNWTASGSIEGMSKLHFVEHAWGESDNKKVAVHEFTHAVVLKLLLDREPQPLNSKVFDQKFQSFPIWLWEALSVYEAGQFVDPKTLPYLSNGQHPSILELNSRSKGGKIYACGYTIIEYILAVFKQDKLIQLIENYGDLKKTLNITDDQFSNGWYDFVKEKYLNKPAANIAFAKYGRDIDTSAAVR